MENVFKVLILFKCFLCYLFKEDDLEKVVRVVLIKKINIKDWREVLILISVWYIFSY